MSSRRRKRSDGVPYGAPSPWFFSQVPGELPQAAVSTSRVLVVFTQLAMRFGIGRAVGERPC